MSSVVDKSDPKQRILDAAREIFAAKGKEGARMREIAERAGVNQAMLHYYFGSKDNIYTELIRSVFSELTDNLRKIFSAPGDLEKIVENYVNFHIDFIAAHPEMPPIMLRDMAQGRGEVLDFLAQNLAGGDFVIPKELTRMTEEAIAAGKLRPINPRQTFVSIVAMEVFYFVARPILRAVWGIDDEKSFIEERKKAIMDLLRHGIFSPGANNPENKQPGMSLLIREDER